MTEARQNLSQQVKGRRGRAVDKAWAHRMLLLRAGDTLTEKAAHRLSEVFAADDPTGTLQAVWQVKEQLRFLLRTGSLEDAATAKQELEDLVKAAARRRRAGSTAPSAGGGKRSRSSLSPGPRRERSRPTTRPSSRSSAPRADTGTQQLQIDYPLEKCRPDGGMTLIPGIYFPTNREEPERAIYLSERRCRYAGKGPLVPDGGSPVALSSRLCAVLTPDARSPLGCFPPTLAQMI
ncbi:hypothetical protein AHiyo8_46010 [Arthrobacter sp. Hiyo8]|nr:hypothetical protein AHiyo8_46010 [Arthrobacter sp. Hiyo8]